LTISSAFHIVIFFTTIDHYLLIRWRHQRMERLVNHKHSKMCSITTKLIQDRKQNNIKCIRDFRCIWDFIFENWREKDHNVRSWHWQSQKTSSCSHIDYISTIRVKTQYRWTTFYHFSPKNLIYNKYNRCVGY